MSRGKVLVYGGKGALGSACVQQLKSSFFWVANVDHFENHEADLNVRVPRDVSWQEQEDIVNKELYNGLRGDKLKAIVCVAGGWTPGNSSRDLSRSSELMWRQSVWISSIAATIASKYLSDDGLLTLTGARAALDPTPRALGYGMAKAAVHQLTKSLSAKGSGIPSNATVLAILPDKLDTEMNRNLSSKEDYSSWTPLNFVAELLEKWINGADRPPSGSLITLVTKNSVTELVPVNLQGTVEELQQMQAK